ncbi:MAG: ice-binding family protein, partial [Cereibacter changlensis]
MSQRLRLSLRAAVAALPLGCTLAGASAAQDLISFAVVSGATITNTGPTTITGNIALSPGTSFTGNTEVTLSGPGNAIYLTDAVAGRIKNDLATLYNVLAARPTSAMGDLTGQALGNRTLVAGVYNYATSADLVGTLTLDGGGDPDALFIINIGTTLTAGSDSEILLTNGAQGGNVFFRVGTSATINTEAALIGQILALQSITLNNQATVNCGAVLARNGAVTLDTNTISVCTLAAAGFDPDPAEVDLSENEREVADALAELGGALPTSFAILAATQSGDELAATLSQLSGEVATGVAPTVMQSMDDFLDTVLRSTRQPFAPAVPSDPGVPVGWVPEKINAAYSSKYDREAPAAAPSLAYAAAEPRNWDMWLSGYGSRNVIDGDASMGSGELTSNNRGVAAGLVYSPGDGASFGLSLSSAKSDFDIADGAGSGESDSIFLALSARKAMDAFYVEGALAFGRSDISTDR